MSRAAFLALGVSAFLACERGRPKNDGDTTTGVTTTIGMTTITSGAIALTPREGDPSLETDQQMIRRVETALASNPAISIAARNVRVDVTNGVVILHGSVDDTASKEALGLASENVANTGGTLNELDVSASRNEHDHESDENIASSLERSLSADPDLSAADRDRVTTDIVYGIVTLRGRVASSMTSRAIEKIVNQTPGVVMVENQLTSVR